MKNQKGGLLHYLNENIIENFISPSDGFDSDCCPCVFNLLGIEKQLFRILQDFARGRGMTNPEIAENLRIYFQDIKGYDTDNINIEIKSTTTEEELNKIISQIPNNYGIFTGYSRSDGTGHCILIGNINNELVILDPQHIYASVYGFENVMKYLEEQNIVEISFFIFSYRDTGDYVRSFQRNNERGIFLENYINLDINIPDLVNNDIVSFSIPKNSNITVSDMNNFWDTIDYTDFLKIDKNRGCSINALTYLGIIRTYAEGDMFVSLLNNNKTKNEVIYPGAAEIYGGLLDHPGALNFSEVLGIVQDKYFDKLINKKNNTIFKLKELKYNFLEDVEMERFLKSDNFIIPDENSEMFYQRFISLLENLEYNFMNKHFTIVKFNRKCIPNSNKPCYYGHTQIIYKEDEQLFIIDPQVVKIYNTSKKLETEEGKRQLAKLYINQAYIGVSFISGSWEQYNEPIQEFLETPFIELAENKLEENNVESWIGDENTIEYVKNEMNNSFPYTLKNISLSQLKWRLFDLYEKQSYKDVEDVYNVITKTVNNEPISKDEWEKFFNYLYNFGGKDSDDRDIEAFEQMWVEDLPNRDILDNILSKDINYKLSNIEYDTEKENIMDIEKKGGVKKKNNSRRTIKRKSKKRTIKRKNKKRTIKRKNKKRTIKRKK